MACADVNCANVPAAAAGQGSGRVYDETFVRHWDAWAEPGVRSRIFTFPLVDGRPQGAGTPVAPNLVGDSPSKPFGGGEEIAWSPDGRTLYFTLREGGRTEPNSTNLDIFAVPADGSARAGQPHRRQSGHGHRPRRLARRPLARLHRDGARRPTRPTARSSSSAISPPARPAR